jgi:hypothetical protein
MDRSFLQKFDTGSGASLLTDSFTGEADLTGTN